MVIRWYIRHGNREFDKALSNDWYEDRLKKNDTYMACLMDTALKVFRDFRETAKLALF